MAIVYPLRVLPLHGGGFTVVDADGKQVFPGPLDGPSASEAECRAFIERDTDEAERELDEGLRDNPHVSARWLGEMGKEQRSN